MQSQNIFRQHLTGLSHTLFHESQIVRSVVQYRPSMHITLIVVNSVTLFLVVVTLSNLALLYCVFFLLLAECAGCQEELKEGQALIALERQWHIWCFKCRTCDAVLHGEYMGK